MLAILNERCRGVFEAVAQWWRDRSRRDFGSLELKCCGEETVERIARDIGVTRAELHKLVQRGPHSADLLLRRMAALDLDPKEVSQIEPRMFQDLQKVCTLCESRRRCTRDLALGAEAQWREYCPNAAMLMALNALPWAARREW